MKALVFAAGLGTRLKPFTDHHPKALVEIGGVPMLERVICKLVNCGVREMVVNVHHMASQIIDFLRDKQNFGIDIHISDESDLLLDTGGGILAARKWLDGTQPFIVHNADILTDFDLKEMESAHDKDGAVASLLVAKRDTSRYLLLDKDYRMRGWTNIKTEEVKPTSLNCDGLEKWAFGGVHIISPEIFPMLEKFAAKERKFSIMPFYIDACDKAIIKGYQPSKPYKWFDIGTPQTLKLANEYMES